MIFVEYSPTGNIKDGDIRFVLINEQKRKRITIYCYEKNKETNWYEYLGEVRIFGYYPKQIRKILYNLQKRIREDGEYKNRIIKKPVVISRATSYHAKRWFQYNKNK